MKEFLAWLNSEKSSKLHPVIIAGISHYEFVRIHPFVDGNGINQWLEYFTEGVRVSILRVKEKVLQLSLERQKQREGTDSSNRKTNEDSRVYTEKWTN